MRGSDFSLPSPLFKYKSFSWLLVKDTVNSVVLCMTLLSGSGSCSVSQMIWPLAVVFPYFSHIHGRWIFLLSYFSALS